MSNNRHASDKSNAEKELQEMLKDLQDKAKRQDKSESIPDALNAYIAPHALSSKYIDSLELNQRISDTHYQPKSSSAGQATGFSGSPLRYDAGPYGSGGGSSGGGGGGSGIGCGVVVLLLAVGFVIWLIVRIIRWLI